MKTYIRQMIDDLKRQREKDRIPPVPSSPTDGKTAYLDPPPQEPVAEDLNNQILSGNPLELEEQLDFQAQENEERETLE
jgi:hypothetical protein